jgi:protein-tyrosine phosphatase
MAEGIMRAKVTKLNLTDIIIDSCGFEHYHQGDPPDKRAIHVCKAHGIDISHLRQRLFKVSDFDQFDCIYVMDKNNYYDVKYVARNETDMAKVDYILNSIYPSSNKPIPDPYYGTIENYEAVYDMLDKACDAILAKINY